MGQAEVLEEIEKNPKKEFTAKELTKILGVTESPIRNSLAKLYKQGLITKREGQTEMRVFCYFYKLRK